MTHARLTLTMIVKDEAELLPRFLESVRGLADELVVVDTGSTDGTVELLERAGARVIHRPWTGDFSAARNAGLEQATGDWVLFLDPDELVSSQFKGQVRELLNSPNAGAATVRMVNRLPHGHSRQTQLLRLFRRDPSIRFRHAIHEDVSEDVFAHLHREQRVLEHLSAEVEHLGYVRERAAARNKKDRDLAILNSSLERSPQDLYCHFKVLELARFWNDRTLWRSAATRAAEAVQRASPQELAHLYFGGELVSLISQGMAADAAGALAYLDSFAGKLSPSAAFHLRRGELCELIGQAERAEAEFRSCLTQAHHYGHQQLATVRPLLGLARLRIQQGRLSEAAELVEQALQHNGRDLEGLLAGAVLARARGGANAVYDWAGRRVAAWGDSLELRQALAEEALAAGDARAAIPEFERACGSSLTGPMAVRLAQAHLGAANFDAAYELTRALSHSQPEAALGLVVLNLLQGRDTQIDVDLEQEQADACLRSWVEAISLSRSPPLIEGLRQFAPALYGNFPWLHRMVSRLPAAH